MLEIFSAKNKNKKQRKQAFSYRWFPGNFCQIIYVYQKKMALIQKKRQATSWCRQLQPLEDSLFGCCCWLCFAAQLFILGVRVYTAVEVNIFLPQHHQSPEVLSVLECDLSCLFPPMRQIVTSNRSDLKKKKKYKLNKMKFSLGKSLQR